MLGRWILGLGIWRVLLRLHVRLHLRLHLLLHLRLHVWLHVWLHRWWLHLRLWLWLRLWLVLRWLLLGRLRLGRLGRILAAIPGRTWVLRWIPAGGRCKTVLAPAGRRRLRFDLHPGARGTGVHRSSLRRVHIRRMARSASRRWMTIATGFARAICCEDEESRELEDLHLKIPASRQVQSAIKVCYLLCSSA